MDARTLALLKKLADNDGAISVLEGDFDDDLEDQHFFTSAIADNLIRLTPGSAAGMTYRISMLPAGWRRLGLMPPEPFRQKAARFIRSILVEPFKA